MLPKTLRPRRIATKLIVIYAVVLAAVAGIIVCTLALSHQTRTMTVGLLDRDVPQVISNAELSRNLNQVFADIHLLLSTFTLEEGILSSEANDLLSILHDCISDSDETGGLHEALVDFTAVSSPPE